MECPICTCEFNGTSQKPLLCKCGNSICEECVTLIVVKGGNNFTCPLCKYSVKGYKESALGINKALETLILELEALRVPFKERSVLTEKLILKNQETQFCEETNIKTYNEFISVYGVLTFAFAFLPWVNCI